MKWHLVWDTELQAMSWYWHKSKTPGGSVLWLLCKGNEAHLAEVTEGPLHPKPYCFVWLRKYGFTRESRAGTLEEVQRAIESEVIPALERLAQVGQEGT